MGKEAKKVFLGRCTYVNVHRILAFEQNLVQTKDLKTVGTLML